LRNTFWLHFTQSEANSVYSTNSKERSRANSYSRNRQDRSEKTNWIEVKRTEAVFLKLLWSPGINSKELIPPAYAPGGLYNNPIPTRFLVPLDCSKVPSPCWYFKQSMGTRNRVGIGLLYRPARASICKPFKEPGIDSQPGGPVRQPYLLYRLARLHRLAESMPWNQFLGSLNVNKYVLRLHWLAELVPWNRFLGS
jgi:hypothetical protein